MSGTTQIVLVVTFLAIAWGAVFWYSRRTYHLEDCQVCDGSGRQWEPWWMARTCCRSYRRYKRCPACDGTPTHDLRQR